MNYEVLKRKILYLYRKEKNTIITKKDNVYNIANIYKLYYNNKLWDITKYDTFIETVSTSAIAMSWCIADITKQYDKASKLLVLDNEKQIKQNNINMYKGYIKKYELTDRREILLSRISNETYICKSIQNKINTVCEKINTIKLKGSKKHGIK